MSWLESPAVRLLLGLLAAALFLLPLWRAAARQRRQAQAHLRETDAMIADAVAALRESAAAGHAQDRAETARTVHEAQESIVQVIGEISRLTQQQMDSLARQSGQARLDIDARLEAYDRQMTRIAQTSDEKLAQNERRMEEMRRTIDIGMRQMRAENEQKLEQIRQTVDEKLNATLDKRLGESFRTVSERLEQVYRGLGEMQQLATGVGDLKRVLTGVKTRGIWGEAQLGALLAQVLAPGQYEENVCVKPGGTERVEFAVRLPGRDEGTAPVYLPIDAKFPVEDYQRLLSADEAGDAQRADEAARALDAAIRTEARRIHAKYIDPPNTTDFAILFLPVEGLYAQALRRPGTVEELQRTWRVVVAGPTTMLALLSSLQMGFKQVAIEKRSSEVWALLGAVKGEFGKFSELLTRTQQRLRQASDSIEDAARKTRTIERRLRDVQELPTGAPQIDWTDEGETDGAEEGGEAGE